MDTVTIKSEEDALNPEVFSDGLLLGNINMSTEEIFSYDEGVEISFSRTEDMDISKVEVTGGGFEDDSETQEQAEDHETEADDNADAESYTESTPELVNLESSDEEDNSLLVPRIDSCKVTVSYESELEPEPDPTFPADAADVRHDHIFAKTSKPVRSQQTKPSKVIYPKLLKPKPPNPIQQVLPAPAPSFPQYIIYATSENNVFRLTSNDGDPAHLGQFESMSMTGMDRIHFQTSSGSNSGLMTVTGSEILQGQQQHEQSVTLKAETNLPFEAVATTSNNSHAPNVSFQSKKQPRRPALDSEVMKSSVLNITVPGGGTLELQRYIYTEALCRVCLLSKPNMAPIFEDLSVTDQGLIENSRGPNACKKFNLITALKQMMDIEVSYGDALPDQICFECIDSLMAFSEFRKRISSGQNKLSEILEQVKNSSSPTVIPQLGVADDSVPEIYRHADLINNIRVLLRTTKYSHNVVRYLPDRILDKMFNVISATVGYKSERLKCLETYAVDFPYVKGWFCGVCRTTVHGSTADFIHHFQEEHVILETDQVLFGCDFCDEHFPLVDKTGLTENYATHWIQHFFFFECDVCQKRMPSAKGVWVHKRSAHANRSRPFKCSHCEKSFIKKNHLIMHLKTHLKPEARKVHMSWCSICGKGLNSSLSAHMNSVHSSELGKTPRWKCEICSKQFSKKENLISHRGTAHTSSENHSCEICGEEFESHSAKTLHVLRHKGIQTHPCNECDKKFLSESTLQSHNATHHYRPNLGSGNFACQICGKAFKRKTYLSEHMHVHGEPQHVCPYPECAKSIRLKSNWYKHLKVHQRREQKLQAQEQEPVDVEQEAFEITLDLEPE